MSYDSDKRSQSVLLVAVLLALLLHFVGVVSFYEFSGLFSDETIEEEEPDQITLVDPPEAEPEPEPEPEPVVPQVPKVPPPPPLPPAKPIFKRLPKQKSRLNTGKAFNLPH